MLANLPFLISANSVGVIGLIVFLASSVLFMIPTFATRGRAQAAWFALGSFLLLVEAAVIVTLVVLTSRGDIWS